MLTAINHEIITLECDNHEGGLASSLQEIASQCSIILNPAIRWCLMKFDAIDWVRKVRDENYEKCKKMSMPEKIAYTKKMARNLSKKRAKDSSTG
jgi:hypothetical protein